MHTMVVIIIILIAKTHKNCLLFVLTIKTNFLSLFSKILHGDFLFATPAACGSLWARNGTCTTAAAQAAVVTALDP